VQFVVHLTVGVLGSLEEGVLLQQRDICAVQQHWKIET